MYKGIKKNCIFCGYQDNLEIIDENSYCFAILDKHPVTKGHTLIIPKRHVADYFEMSGEELNSCNDLLHKRHEELLRQDVTIKGFNIGVNVGEYAGQTIFHCHIHLIPRRKGDNPFPKGGVRGVIPDRQNY